MAAVTPNFGLLEILLLRQGVLLQNLPLESDFLKKSEHLSPSNSLRTALICETGQVCSLFLSEDCGSECLARMQARVAVLLLHPLESPTLPRFKSLPLKTRSRSALMHSGWTA